MSISITKNDMKVADEAFVATALLQRENPGRDAFTVSEIVRRAIREFGEVRPGVQVHASLHCVANRPPNSAPYKMLYATPDNRRRLLRSGDDIHPERTGKIWPDPDEVPTRYHELIEWAKARYGKDSPRPTRWMEGILKLRGMGRQLFTGEDADAYVKGLREGWK
jgi:hypothetical protein